MKHLIYVSIGLCTGLFSGLLGIGGGLIVIPILIYFLGVSQHQAQGTSLAMMIPPVTLLAALQYYRSGYVKIDMAVFIAAGFALGGLLGAGFAQHIPEAILRKAFGVMLLAASIRMVFFK